MTRAELKAEIARVRTHGKGGYAYAFAHGKKGLVEVRVRADGSPWVTPVNTNGRPIGKAKRVRPWTSI